jgi:hypothetical protein
MTVGDFAKAFATFKLNRLSQGGGLVVSPNGGCMPHAGITLSVVVDTIRWPKASSSVLSIGGVGHPLATLDFLSDPQRCRLVGGAEPGQLQPLNLGARIGPFGPHRRDLLLQRRRVVFD